MNKAPVKKHNNSKRFEDGYHSKHATNASRQRKKFKHLDNAIRSKDLDKLMTYEETL